MNEDLKFIISLLGRDRNRPLSKNKVGYLADRNGFSVEKARLDPLFEQINIHRIRKPGGYYYEYWYISPYRRKEIKWLLRK